MSEVNKCLSCFKPIPPTPISEKKDKSVRQLEMELHHEQLYLDALYQENKELENIIANIDRQLTYVKSNFPSSQEESSLKFSNPFWVRFESQRESNKKLEKERKHLEKEIKQMEEDGIVNLDAMTQTELILFVRSLERTKMDLTCALRAAEWSLDKEAKVKEAAKQIRDIPWPGARLKAVEGNELPGSMTLTAFLPNCTENSNQEILEYLGNQEEKLNINDWKILSRDDGIGITQFKFSVDAFSAIQLRKVNFVVHFKFDRIVLKPETERPDEMFFNSQSKFIESEGSGRRFGEPPRAFPGKSVSNDRFLQSFESLSPPSVQLLSFEESLMSISSDSHYSPKASCSPPSPERSRSPLKYESFYEPPIIPPPLSEYREFSSKIPSSPPREAIERGNSLSRLTSSFELQPQSGAKRRRIRKSKNKMMEGVEREANVPRMLPSSGSFGYPFYAPNEAWGRPLN